MSTKQTKRSHHAAKPASSSEPKSKSIIHEHDRTGRHRIVIIENGVPDAGQWCENYQIAHHRGLCAATGYYSPALPAGIFRAASVAHQRLGEVQS